MAELRTIGLTLAGGSTVLAASLLCFGLAIKHRSSFIAARATARPPDVIWNPRPRLQSQHARGNPWTGWIPWTLQLTYDTMLNGIPGTGTREGGLSGSLLRVNLDGIVLIRFHALGLRVSCLAACLLIVLALPSYLSAQCYTREDIGGEGCTTNAYNLTNYERTTLANVPQVSTSDYRASLVHPSDGILWRLYLVVGIFWVLAGYLCYQLKQEWIQILAMRRVYYLEYDIWGSRREELKQTLMYEEIAAKKREKLEKEYEALDQNPQQTNNTIKSPPENTTSGESNDAFLFNYGENAVFKQKSERDITPQQAQAIASREPHLTHRDPWIPHPEQRDTVPNIALYSILVGGLPSLPEQAADSFDAEATIQFSKRESIDWQLSLTTTFFDHCVPNQPGFSSSVAAVTIIPSAMDLSVAWRKWYAAAAKLRRLRFIREQIALRRHFDIEAANRDDGDDDYADDDDDDKVKDMYGYGDDDDDQYRYGNNNNNDTSVKSKSNGGGGGSETDYGYGDGTDYGYGDPSQKSESHTDYGYNQEMGYGDPPTKSSSNNCVEIDYGYGDSNEVFVRADATEEEVAKILAKPSEKKAPKLPRPDKESFKEKDETPRGIYSEPMKNKEYYKAVLGSALGTDHETHIYDSLEFGPEQAAVYAREFAQSAAPLCPNGCNECGVRRAPIDQLLEMERIVAVEVHQANLELREARKRATRAEASFTNLHDAQRGTDAKVNLASPASVAGGAMYASPHSMAAGGVNTRRASTAPNLSTTQEGDEDGEEGDGAAAVVLAQQPMASRYDRRRSNHNDGEEAVTAIERPKTKPIDASRLDMVAKSSDLGLEAQLFKKSSAHERNSSAGGIKASSRNILGPSKTSLGRSSGMKKPPSIAERAKTEGEGLSRPLPPSLTRSQSDGASPATSRKVELRRLPPSMDGLKVPPDICLETQLISDYSTGSSGSRGRRPSTGRRRKLADRNTATTYESKTTSNEELRQRRAASRAMMKQGELDSDKESHNDTYKSGVLGGSSSGHWLHVETIITEASASDRSTASPKSVGTGKWEMPSFKNLFHRTRENTKNIKKAIEKQTKEAVEHLARESTYAVVTFTSRQAAVAARACLADGRGAGRWVTLKEMPIPPLADAAPGDLMTFRNWCRPVTLSINERQKNCRHYIAILLLGTIFVFYTIPLTAASTLANPNELLKIFPNFDGVSEDQAWDLTVLLSGLLTAGIWSLFFALCPILFKTIANFGSKAESVANAEFKALQYFWWFMVLTAFSGQLLANMALSALNEGFGSQFQELLRRIAETIPSQISVNWMNWIIFRFTIILPLNYLVQVNTFLFHFFGMYCCARMVRGGGPGGPVPYRIYIDSGVVLLCLMALAPASPLVAPACVAYFLFCQPMLRWNLIFLYRPKFDGGGFRWPFIFDMCITTLYVGSLLLTVQMVLKQAAGPAVGAVLVMVPLFMFQKDMKTRFLRSFEDAALLQTSLLDGWDNSLDYSFEKRQEFRQFLVDAHKAAYIPICLAGTDTDEFLTAEPAVVVEDEEFDDFWDEEEEEVDLNQSAGSLNHQPDSTPSPPPVPSSPRSTGATLPSSPKKAPRTLASSAPNHLVSSTAPPVAANGSADDVLLSPVKKSQHGVTLRRTANKMRRRVSNIAHTLVDQDHITKLLEDKKASISPFERPVAFEREESRTNILDAVPARPRRRSIAAGSSWRSKSSSSLDIGGQQRPAGRGMTRARSSSRDQSWASRSTMSADLANVYEEIEILSLSEDPSTSYTNSSGSKNAAKFD